MIWLIGLLIFFLLVLSILLLSPFSVVVDTRVPAATFKWQNIGRAVMWYDEEWRLYIQLFFYSKTISIRQLKNNSSKKKNVPKKEKKINKRSNFLQISRLLRVLKSFRVIEWELAIDTGDYTSNAELYALNFIPFAAEHLHINFTGDNYLLIKITNRPLNVLVAYFR